jgi:hypothetical protein
MRGMTLPWQPERAGASPDANHYVDAWVTIAYARAAPIIAPGATPAAGTLGDAP